MATMIKTTMTFKQLLELNQGLEAAGKLKGARFAYAVARTMKSIEKDIASLNTARQASDEYIKYIKERNTITIAHADKDGDNKPIPNPDNSGFPYVICESEQIPLKQELKVLDKKYAKVIAEAKQQDADYKKLLDDECTVDLYQVHLNDLPTDLPLFIGEALLPIISGLELDDKAVTKPVEFETRALLEYKYTFESLFNVTEPKLVSVMLKNFLAIKRKVNELYRAEVRQQYLNYDAKRVELCVTRSTKDAWSNPMMYVNPMTNRREYLIANRTAFDKDIESLNAKNEELLKNFKEFNSTMLTLNLVPISIEDVPEDITPEQMEVLMDIIND